MAALALPLAAFARPDVDRFIAAQGWKKHEHYRPPAMPAAGIIPMMYFADGSSGPSCGLLASRSESPIFIPMLGPAPGRDYPQCAGVSDAAAFEAGGNSYLVFELLNRDAKVDQAVAYFYVSRSRPGRYAADHRLNRAVASAGVTAAAAKGRVAGAAEGVRRARIALIHAAVPGMNYLAGDSITDGARTFASFTDPARTRCDFVLEAGSRVVKIGHHIFADGDMCLDVLATSRFERAGTTYFLAMFKGLRKKRMAVVSVTRANVVTAEKELASLATDNVKMTELRSVKEYIRARLK